MLLSRVMLLKVPRFIQRLIYRPAAAAVETVPSQTKLGIKLEQRSDLTEFHRANRVVLSVSPRS